MNIKSIYILLIIFLTSSTSFNANAQNSRLDRIEDGILLDLAKSRTRPQTEVLMFLSKNYQYIDYSIPVGMFVGGAIGQNKELRQNAAYVASSTLISYGLSAIIKKLVKRDRPFIRNVSITPVYEPTRYSFPSGHTALSISTATALSISYPKWYVIAPSFLWAGATSYSRMYLGVHYPTDVAGGAVLGAGTAASLIFLKKP
ncbi:phosphatase PAP2 family protein [Mucilaginibacter sp. PAMB04274]|uniref:phosphatase PAP2 family protein n=1 Tax=Mucilaginibacter sp. PAMB04274 TaxID=3138568 RepID=UPI0031F69620